MFCQKCGHEIVSSEDGFCQFCGSSYSIGAAANQFDQSDRQNSPNNTVKVDQITYALLAIFLGGFGINYFYAGKPGKGILCLLTCWTGITEIIVAIIGISALFKKADANGQIEV